MHAERASGASLPSQGGEACGIRDPVPADTPPRVPAPGPPPSVHFAQPGDCHAATTLLTIQRHELGFIGSGAIVPRVCWQRRHLASPGVAACSTESARWQAPRPPPPLRASATVCTSAALPALPSPPSRTRVLSSRTAVGVARPAPACPPSPAGRSPPPSRCAARCGRCTRTRRPR